MGRALFLMPCCSRKVSGGFNPPWGQVKEENGLKFLNEHREQLVEYYNNLSEEEAPYSYKGNRGTGDTKLRKILKAWNKNQMIPESKTMKAINRYDGHLYSAIGSRSKIKLESGEIDNVLIVSAMFGIIKPTDLIPDYELVMSDKAGANKIAKYWNRVFHEQIEQLNPILSSYDHIYCLMSDSTGYMKSVASILLEHDAYHIAPLAKGQSNKLQSWGYVLDTCLQNGLNTPAEVKQAVEMHNCSMSKVITSSKTRGKMTTTSLEKIDRGGGKPKPPPLDPDRNKLPRPGPQISGCGKASTDEIRNYIYCNIILPAKSQGSDEITIRAGDIHSAMKLKSRMPSVCSALKGLDKYYPVELISIQAPPSGKGSNFYATYKI